MRRPHHRGAVKNQFVLNKEVITAAACARIKTDGHSQCIFRVGLKREMGAPKMLYVAD